MTVAGTIKRMQALSNNSVCSGALAWLKAQPAGSTSNELWTGLPRGEWMLWRLRQDTALQTKGPEMAKAIARAALDCSALAIANAFEAKDATAANAIVSQLRVALESADTAVVEELRALASKLFAPLDTDKGRVLQGLGSLVTTVERAIAQEPDNRSVADAAYNVVTRAAVATRPALHKQLADAIRAHIPTLDGLSTNEGADDA